MEVRLYTLWGRIHRVKDVNEVNRITEMIEGKMGVHSGFHVTISGTLMGVPETTMSG